MNVMLNALLHFKEKYSYIIWRKCKEDNYFNLDLCVDEFTLNMNCAEYKKLLDILDKSISDLELRYLCRGDDYSSREPYLEIQRRIRQFGRNASYEQLMSVTNHAIRYANLLVFS